MPIRHIDAADIDYYLVLFDSDGNERPETDGSMLSAKLAELVADGVTDVFFSSHGWKGDVPAAISQYDAWIGAMAAQSADRNRVDALDPNYKSLIVGVHWPSLPWGNERADAALLGDDEDEVDEFEVEQHMTDDELIARYSERIAATDEAKAALTTILAAADNDQLEQQLADGTVPADLEAAYQTLFTQAGLGLDGASAAPGSDQATFTPSETISTWSAAHDGEPGEPGLLGGGFLHKLKDAVLMPVRQVSFWAMKHRARHVGETGVHTLLSSLQTSAPTARFHLMGHSFGCIVVTAAVAGPIADGALGARLPRPVQSLFLVQGAMSLWSFADAIPYPPSVPGYFQPLETAPALVAGPIVTTRSTFDHAVGTFFPLGARLGNDRLLGDEPPEYGGVGAFGIAGTDTAITHDVPTVLNADADYGFEAGHIYNVECSTVICHGGGPSGAHSDIAHPEIAHVFWQAALVGMQID